jgi:hypothetical protein
MKLALTIVIAALILALLGGAAGAYPTRFGPVTGLVDMPTTEPLTANDAELAIDYAPLGGDTNVWPIRLLIGLPQDAEVGVGYARFKDGIDDKITSFGGKVRFLREPTSKLSLAFGANYLSGNIFDTLNVFAVAGREISRASGGPYGRERFHLHGYVGLMFTNISNSVSDDEFKPFLGLEALTPEGAGLVAEYKFTKFGKDHVGAAVRYRATPRVTVQVGIARGTPDAVHSDEFRFLFGGSYNLSPPAEPPILHY